MLKFSPSMASIALALSLGLAGAASAEDKAVVERLDDRASFASGKEAWDSVCARCHTTIDDKIDQAVGPDLSTNEYDPDTIKYFVRNGQLAMPAFPESALDNKTLDELAAYIAKEVYKGEAQ